MSVGVIYTNNNITIIDGDKTQSFSAGDPDFDRYVKLWKAADFAGIKKLLHQDKVLIEQSLKDSRFEAKDGIIEVQGRPVVKSVADRIRQFAEQKKDASRLINFWERLKKNPSYWCVESLFDFLDRHKCPIAEDGRFMAFKAVRENFKDKHTGKVDNTPGTKVAPFDRNKVDDDKQKACSFGYHVESDKYVNNFGASSDKFIEVLIDPADVVSIPLDVGENKIRVCTYEVVAEIKRKELDYNKFSGVYDTPQDD